MMASSALPQVKALDACCFVGEPFAAEWWEKAVEARGAGAWLAVEKDHLLAYCLFSRVLDEAELLRIATEPTAQRRGVASALLSHARSALHAEGTRQLFLEVRASNMPAQQLYQRDGWHMTGRRKDYYPQTGGREDALIFSREL